MSCYYRKLCGSFLASFNVRFSYNEIEKSSILLPALFDYSSSNIQEPNNCICKEFVSIGIKNRVIHLAIVEIKEI